MSLEIFLLLLLIVSIFTGLFTEGIKKLMDEVNKKLKEFRELGMLGYHDQGNWRKWGI